MYYYLSLLSYCSLVLVLILSSWSTASVSAYRIPNELIGEIGKRVNDLEALSDFGKALNWSDVDAHFQVRKSCDAKLFIQSAVYSNVRDLVLTQGSIKLPECLQALTSFSFLFDRIFLTIDADELLDFGGCEVCSSVFNDIGITHLTVVDCQSECLSCFGHFYKLKSLELMYSEMPQSVPTSQIVDVVARLPRLSEFGLLYSEEDVKLNVLIPGLLKRPGNEIRRLSIQNVNWAAGEKLHTDQDLEMLIDAISDVNCKLVKLVLIRQSFTNLSLFSELIHGNRKLEDLELSQHASLFQQASEDELKEFGKAIANSLRSIGLVDCNLNDFQVQSIFSVPTPHLLKLNLRGNRVQMVPEIHAQNLIDLDLSLNNIIWVNSTPLWEKIESLSLSDNRIVSSCGGISSLSRALLKLVNLKHLYLRNIGLSASSLKTLFRNKSAILKTLDLSENNIGDEGLSFLAFADHKLDVVLLESCGISHFGVLSLANVLDPTTINDQRWTFFPQIFKLLFSDSADRLQIRIGLSVLGNHKLTVPAKEALIKATSFNRFFNLFME